MRILPFICIILLSILHSCTDSAKEKSLEKREQDLLTKQKEFDLKKQDYQQLIIMRDSIKNNAVDAEIELLTFLPESILGNWNGKMVCKESNCPDNVIGDQRNDRWEFTANSLKIINNSGGERIFIPVITDSEIKFTSEESTTVSQKTEIVFNLNDFKNNRLKGSREILGKNDCIAKFTVDLERTKN